MSVENDKVILSQGFPEDRMPVVTDVVVFLFKEKRHLPVIGRVEAIEKKGQSTILSFGPVALEDVFDEFKMAPTMNGSTPLKLVVDESSEGEDADYRIVDRSVWETLEVLEATGDYERQATKGFNADIQDPIDFVTQIPVSHKSLSGKIYIRIHGSVTFNGCKDADMDLSQEIGIDGQFDFTAIGTKEPVWIPLFKGKKIHIYGNPLFGIAFTPNVGIFYSGKISVSSGFKFQLLNSNYRASIRDRKVVESQGKEDKRNAYFKVFTLKSEGEFGLYTEAELFAFAVDPGVFSFGADVKSGVSIKGEKEVGIQFPDFANLDFLVSLYPFLYVTPYVYAVKHKYSFPDKGLSLRGNPFLVSLLPAFAINKAKRSGNTVPVEGTYFKESFISSKDDGVALFIKGQDKPLKMKSLRSPKTKSSSNSLTFSVEDGKQYEVATYIETEKDGIVYDERIDIDGRCPDDKHVHAIDLGLSVKWACCNVGATKPEESGGYYAWGETEEKSVYNQVTYKYVHGTDWDGDGMYEEGHYEGVGKNEHWVKTPITWDDIGTEISGTQYDVAHVKWGGNWRMPTRDEWIELLDNCTLERIVPSIMVNPDGLTVSLGKLTSKKNGNSIILPLAYALGDAELSAWCQGYYWSSSLSSSGPNYAYGASILNEDDTHITIIRRYNGLSVRPVSD